MLCKKSFKTWCVKWKCEFTYFYYITGSRGEHYVLYAIKYKWWKNKYKIGKAILNVDAWGDVVKYSMQAICICSYLTFVLYYIDMV